jgi:Protein of unknown function (DUF2793)
MSRSRPSDNKIVAGGSSHGRLGGGSKLRDLIDVLLSATPATGDLLRFNGTKWINWIPDFLNPTNGYTKTDIDNKLNAAVLGLEHEAAVLSRTDIPPASPILGDTHIVGVTPTGVWVGQNNFLARWDGTAWQFSAPRTNESHLIEDVGETWHWNGTNWVKVAVAQAAATSTGELWQVGSIQQSLLTETQWASVLGPEAAKWVLADGRNVAGSRWATVTGQTTVPDLRGAFLRAAGQNSNAQPNWNGNAVGSFHNDTTRMPRNTPFTASASTAGEHKHWQTVAAFTGGSAGTHTWSGGTPTAAGEETWANGNHSHTITVAGGDTETAPVHYSVFTYIKVN